MAHIHAACKFENKKLTIQISRKRHLNYTNGSILLETQNEEEFMWESSQKCSCVEITILCIKLTHCHAVVLCGSILHSNSYSCSRYSCRTIHGVQSVRN